MNYFDEYKQSNAQQRLELYLQFPDLRTEFDHIEKTEDQKDSIDSEQLVIVPEKIQNKQSIFVRIKNCCLSLFV
jgi:hypothetical protein